MYNAYVLYKHSIAKPVEYREFVLSVLMDLISDKPYKRQRKATPRLTHSDIRLSRYVFHCPTWPSNGSTNHRCVVCKKKPTRGEVAAGYFLERLCCQVGEVFHLLRWVQGIFMYQERVNMFFRLSLKGGIRALNVILMLTILVISSKFSIELYNAVYSEAWTAGTAGDHQKRLSYALPLL